MRLRAANFASSTERLGLRIGMMFFSKAAMVFVRVEGFARLLELLPFLRRHQYYPVASHHVASEVTSYWLLVWDKGVNSLYNPNVM